MLDILLQSIDLETLRTVRQASEVIPMILYTLHSQPDSR